MARPVRIGRCCGRVGGRGHRAIHRHRSHPPLAQTLPAPGHDPRPQTIQLSHGLVAAPASWELAREARLRSGGSTFGQG